jgi:RNA polymerase sigma factor (sigma-70 family)
VDPGEVFRRIRVFLQEQGQGGASEPHDSKEWDQFFELNSQLFLKLIQSRHSPQEDPNDEIQDLWLMIISRLPDLHFDPSRGRLRDWLLGAARHWLADRERCRQSHPMEHLDPETADLLASRELDPATAFERKRLGELVREALAELQGQIAPRDFEAFTLHWLEGLSVREVAHRLGMTEGQVWSSHHRTRLKLRPLLAQRIDSRFSW